MSACIWLKHIIGMLANACHCEMNFDCEFMINYKRSFSKLIPMQTLLTRILPPHPPPGVCRQCNATRSLCNLKGWTCEPDFSTILSEPDWFGAVQKTVKVKQQVTIDINLNINSYQKLQITNICTVAWRTKGCIASLMYAS